MNPDLVLAALDERAEPDEQSSITDKVNSEPSVFGNP
jgi:hypothetical protein